MILTEDLNVKGVHPLTAPQNIKKEFPITEKASETVFNMRKELKSILDENDTRQVIIVGPCSIHHPDIAIDYAKKLQSLIAQVEDKLLIVMRVYFEKPRTTVGWKGLINDPDLDGSHKIEKGIKLARKILLDINEMGIPCATETLDPITPQYLADLISWSAVGARTTESQTHREMASGLSMPVGFKNGTDGGLEVAINAMQSAGNEHHFLGVSHDGNVSVIRTNGNPYSHLVMRGGKEGPNFDVVSVGKALDELERAKLRKKVMVDCNHANSGKDPYRQELVLRAVIHQINDGRKEIMGTMIESNIEGGNQTICPDMKYGVSITDACLDWENTRRILLDAHKMLQS
jgi:3-deoxy-7-phosphoheptulonate synthase